MGSDAERHGPFRQDPTFDPERRRLGLIVRDLRRRSSFTTRELATRAGVSASLISQVETGKVGASITTLRRLAAGLGVPIAEFFAESLPGVESLFPEPGTNAAVVRHDQRKRLRVPESQILYELLTPDLNWNIEFVSIELQPGHPPAVPMSHIGQECVLVLSGTLHLTIGDEVHILHAGDSAAYDSSIPHKIENHGSERVIQVSAITPPRF
jgi:transcriptional regulator with XRE-family HTH domain